MSKKNLSALMDGILGDSNNPPEEQNKPVVETPQPTSTKELPKKVGRPKSPTSGSEIRATFIVDSHSIRKLKYIGLAEGRLYKDIIGEALDRYIEEWEANNGRIKLPDTKS